MTQRIERWMRLIAALGLAGLLTLAVGVPIMAQDGGFTVGIAAANELTAFIDNATLGSVPYSMSTQSSSGTLLLTVDDQRGTSAGWTVTVQVSDLVYSGTATGVNIPASSFAITNVGPPQWVSGGVIDEVGGGPRVPAANSTGSLSTPRNPLEAANGYGGGKYTQNLAVMLTVPGGSLVGTYTGTMTVTTSAAP